MKWPRKFCKSAKLKCCSLPVLKRAFPCFIKMGNALTFPCAPKRSKMSLELAIRFTVLGRDSPQVMSTALFRPIRKLSSSDQERKLIVYVRDFCPDEEFVSLLASLAEVDFIVLKCESLKNLCEIIHPHQVFVFDEEKLTALDHATDLLSRMRDSLVSDLKKRSIVVV